MPCENNLIDIKKIDVSKCKHNILFKNSFYADEYLVFVYFTNLAYWKKYTEVLECREEE